MIVPLQKWLFHHSRKSRQGYKAFCNGPEEHPGLPTPRFITIDDTTIVLVPGESVDIPEGALHRIANPGSENVRFIEVQTGDYFGEDDIERCDDDFGRT